MRKEIRIGTRASALALWQAEWVKSELEKKYPGMTVSLTKIKTTGDKILDVPLSKVGGKGLFVKEIEEAMLRSEIDIAVHSMKDVPTFFPDGLHLGCITKREDARDALLSRNKVKFKDLPKGANIGTSSLRRQTQIMNIRPDFVIHQLRGNVDTRLRKLKEGQYDAIILAAAGVKRLGLAENVTEYLDPEVSLPAIGQGALGIECRVDDRELNDLIAFFNHAESRVCVTGERALLRQARRRVPGADRVLRPDQERQTISGRPRGQRGRQTDHQGFDRRAAGRCGTAGRGTGRDAAQTRRRRHPAGSVRRKPGFQRRQPAGELKISTEMRKLREKLKKVGS